MRSVMTAGKKCGKKLSKSIGSSNCLVARSGESCEHLRCLLRVILPYLLLQVKEYRLRLCLYQGQTFPPAPPARRFGFSRASTHRPKARVPHLDTSKSERRSSPQTKVEMSAEACICGNSLVQSNRGGRIRHYCSDRCRINAYRKRETQWISSLRRHREEPKEVFLSQRE